MPKGGWDSHWGVQVLLVMIGLGMLVLGSTLLVEATITVARRMGVLGTGRRADHRRRRHVAAGGRDFHHGDVPSSADIAIGNVVGSSTFNILAVLGASSLVAREPLAVAPSVLAFDLPVMTAVAVACFPVFFTGRQIALGKASSSSATTLRTLLT